MWEAPPSSSFFFVQDNELGRWYLEPTPPRRSPPHLPTSGRRVHMQRLTNAARIGQARRYLALASCITLYRVLSASLRRRISSTTRASGAVASMIAPFCGRASLE